MPASSVTASARFAPATLAGLNVTVPHKTRVLALVDAIDPSARATGAANTLVRSADGSVRAFNTDAPALRDELAALAKDAGRFRGRSALVLGTGGAARAAIFALGQLGVARVVVRGRRKDPAELAQRPRRERLEGRARVRTVRRASVDPSDYAAIVQATTAGMDGAETPGDVVADVVAWDRVPLDCVVYDVVYAPPRTPLLLRAAARGLAQRRRAGDARASGRARVRAVARREASARRDAGGARLTASIAPMEEHARGRARTPAGAIGEARTMGTTDRPSSANVTAERIRQVTAKNVQRLGYRRIVQLLVYLIIIPTVLLLAIGIILMFLEARINLLFGILTVSFVSVVITGIVLVLVFVRREANLSELQADFVSKVSHELRTPLTAIRLFAETIQRPEADDATREKCSTLLVAESERLSKMIERLLDWGRMEAGRKNLRAP